MAARQVSGRPRGFSLLEMAAVLAIGTILVVIGGSALTNARKISRVGGEARLILQQLQSIRTSAVSQGAAQGYYFGPNGPGATGADANQGFVFWKLNPQDTVVSYAAALDRVDGSRDSLPIASPGNSALMITGAGVAQPAPFSIGFDMNGQVTVTPGPVVFPYCIQVSDVADPVIVRYVILFDDGTTKVQGDETWCP